MSSKVVNTAVVMFLAVVASSSSESAQHAGRKADRTISTISNRVWADVARSDGDTMTFLSDGTLLNASCRTGYKISSWKTPGSGTITWIESGAVITADVVSVSTVELVLDVDKGVLKGIRIFRAPVEQYSCPPS